MVPDLSLICENSCALADDFLYVEILKMNSKFQMI